MVRTAVDSHCTPFEVRRFRIALESSSNIQYSTVLLLLKFEESHEPFPVLSFVGPYCRRELEDPRALFPVLAS